MTPAIPCVIRYDDGMVALLAGRIQGFVCPRLRARVVSPEVRARAACPGDDVSRLWHPGTSDSRERREGSIARPLWYVHDGGMGDEAWRERESGRSEINMGNPGDGTLPRQRGVVARSGLLTRASGFSSGVTWESQRVDRLMDGFSLSCLGRYLWQRST